MKHFDEVPFELSFQIEYYKGNACLVQLQPLNMSLLIVTLSKILSVFKSVVWEHGGS